MFPSHIFVGVESVVCRIRIRRRCGNVVERGFQSGLWGGGGV